MGAANAEPGQRPGILVQRRGVVEKKLVCLVLIFPTGLGGRSGALQSKSKKRDPIRTNRGAQGMTGGEQDSKALQYTGPWSRNHLKGGQEIYLSSICVFLRRRVRSDGQVFQNRSPAPFAPWPNLQRLGILGAHLPPARCPPRNTTLQK